MNDRDRRMNFWQCGGAGTGKYTERLQESSRHDMIQWMELKEGIMSRQSAARVDGRDSQHKDLV